MRKKKEVLSRKELLLRIVGDYNDEVTKSMQTRSIATDLIQKMTNAEYEAVADTLFYYNKKWFDNG